MNIKLKNKATGDVVNGEMFFLNEVSDGGAASLKTTLENILLEWEIIFGSEEYTATIS